MSESNYDFKADLLRLRRKDLLEENARPAADEYVFVSGVKIYVEDCENPVVMTAVRDFEDFLFTSMDVSTQIVKNPAGASVSVTLGRDLGEASGYMGYRITVGQDRVSVVGYDERAARYGIDVYVQIYTPHSAHPDDALCKLLCLAKFMRNSCRTVLNVKKHYIAKQRLSVIGSKAEAEKLIDEIAAIVETERQNVLDTIPLVRADSRLGWEPSMEYTTDEAGLQWKLRQLDYEANVRIPAYRKANSLTVAEEN